MTRFAPMRFATCRSMTLGERAALSPGLLDALAAAGVSPLIVARPSVFALLAAVWRRHTPVMVIGRRIFWPGARDDFSLAAPRAMSLLQHELQHVLEFRTGALTALGYLMAPANWIYRYRLVEGSTWSAYGAEQRAQIVQDYWLATQGLMASAAPLETYRKVIPWAV